MEVGQGKDNFPGEVLLKSPLGMGTGERVQQKDVGKNRRNNEQTERQGGNKERL